MDLLQQIQKFGTVRAGLPPSFTVTSPTQISVTGSVLNNAGVGGLILHAYTESGRLPSSTGTLPDAFGGKPLGSQLITTVNYSNASFAGQTSNYSIRISGYLLPPAGATYIFRVTCDDGARLWLDSNLVIDSWTYVGGSPVVVTGSVTLFGGTWYSILLEHMATGGSQRLLLEYSTDGTNFKTFSHTSDGTNFSAAYDAFEAPGTRAGSLRVGGPALFTSSVGISGRRKSLLLTTPFAGSITNLSTDLSGAFSLTLWVRHIASSSVQTILSFGGNRHIQINTVNQIVLSPANGVAYSSTVLTPGVPHHITVCLSASGIWSLYVNGTLDTSYTGSYTGTAIAAPSSTALVIGATSDSTPVLPMTTNSLVENLAIFKNVVVTSNDASRLYNFGRRYNLTDLVNTNTYYGNLYLWYQFESDAGTTSFTDSSASSRNLSTSTTITTVQSIIPDHDCLSVSPGSNRIHSFSWVGLGTSIPAAPLHIASSSNLGHYGGALLSVRNVDAGSTKHAGIVVATGNGTASSGGNSFVSFDLVGSGGWSVGQDISDFNKFKICGNNSFMTSTPALTIDASKRLGVNTSSPAYQLDVSGSINFSGSLYQGGVPFYNTQWITTGQNIYYNLGSVGINTSSPQSTLDIVGSARVTGSLSAATLTGSLLSLPTALITKVGIGLSSTGNALDVKGTTNYGQVRIIPATDSTESAISFYRYSNLAQAAAGDTWVLGQNSAGAAPGNFGIGCYGPSGFVSSLFITPAGRVGIMQPNPTAALDISGGLNVSGSISANSLTSSFGSVSGFAHAATLTVGTILNFTAGGSIGTNLYLSGTLTAPAATITSLVASTYTSPYSSISSFAHAATLTVGTILNFTAGGSIGTNLYLSGTLTSPAATITSLVTTTYTSPYSSISGFAHASTLTVGTILNFTAGGSIGTNLYMSGTLTAPAATITSLVTSTYTSTYASISSFAHTSTLTVGTILNFSAGGSIGTNLYMSGTLTAPAATITNLSTSTITCGSLSVNFLAANTLSAGTILNIVFGQTVSAGTTSGTSTAGTITVTGGASFSGTVTASCIGVNQTSPAYPLDVNGDINLTGTFRQNGFPYIGSQWTTAGTNLYYSTGAVGIKTTNPQVDFDVGGTVSSRLLYVIPGTISAIGAATTSDTVLGFARLTSGGSTIANLYGKIAWYGYQRATPSTYISADSNGGFDDVGWLRFGTSNGGGGNATDRLVINNSGQVGINNGLPGYSLDVLGNVNLGSTTADFTLQSLGQLHLRSNVSGANTFAHLVYATGKDATSTAGDHIFFTRGETQERFRITNSGNVGIGNSAPAYTLDITGSERVTGSLSTSTLTATTLSSTFGNISTLSAVTLSATLGSMSTLSATSVSTAFGSITSLTVATLSATNASASTISATSLTSNFGSINSMTIATLSATSGVASTLSTTSLSSIFGSISTLSTSSLTASYGSISTNAYAATLSVGTILNFSAGGTVGTNLYLSGTLTAASISSTFLNVSTLSASTYLNVVFNQQVSSGGTSSGTATAGTLSVAGGGSFSGTITAACVAVNQQNPQYSLDVNGTGRLTGSLTVIGNTLGTLNNRSYLFNAGHISNAAGSITDVGVGSVGLIFSPGGVIDLVNANTASVLRAVGTTVGINNPSPLFTLDVSGNINAGTTLTDSTVQSLGQLHVRSNVSGASTFSHIMYATGKDATSTAGDHIFYTRGETQERMRITNVGFVGVNTSTPSYNLDVVGQARLVSNGSSQLIVKNSSTTNANDACEIFFDRSTGTSSAISAVGVGAGGRGAYWWVNNADRMNINAVGQVGINTGSPAYQLDIAGTVRCGTLVNTSIGTNAGFVMCHSLTSFVTNGAYSSIFDFNFTGPSIGNTTAANTGPNPGGRLLVNDDNFGAAFRWSSKAQGNVANALTERFTILGSGNVGIANASPSYTLDVAGSCRVVVQSSQVTGTMLTLSSSTANRLMFVDETATGSIGCSIRMTSAWTSQISTGGHLALMPGSGSSVGINTTTPAVALDVNGAINASAGIVSVNNSSTTPSSIVTEASGSICNFSLNFRDPTKNTANVGGGVRIDSRSPQTNLFQFLSRVAGSTTDNVICQIGQTGIGSLSGSLTTGGGILIGNAAGVGPATTTDTVLGFSRLSGGGSTTANLYGKIAWYGYSRNTPSAYVSADSNGGFDDLGWLRFGTGNGAGGNAADKMVINPAGQVGINTTSPAYLLDVAGTRRDNNRLAAFRFTYPSAVSIASGSTEILFTGTQAPNLPANSTYVTNSNGRIQVNVSGLWQFTVSFGFDYNAAGNASTSGMANATRLWMSQSTSVLTTPDPSSTAACFTAWEGPIPAFAIQTCSGYVTCTAGTYIQAYINTLSACKSYGWSNYQACSYLTGNLISAN